MDKILLVVLGIFAGILLVVISFELYLRVSIKNDIQRYAVESRLWGNNEGRFVPSENVFLGWEHDKSHPHVNSFGFYGTEYPLEKGKDTFRILVVGDSITENGRYVEILEKMLNASGFGRGFEVWNCGVGGYNLRQYVAFITERAYKYRPDMIIIGFCMNDLNTGTLVCLSDKGNITGYRFPELSKGVGARKYRINRFLLLNSYAYRAFVLMSMGGKENGSDANDVEDCFSLIKESARKNKSPLLAVLIPFFKSNYERAEVESYQILKGGLSRGDIRCLDLHGEFKDPGDVSWRAKADDYVHPSEKGHEVIADGIYRYLVNNTQFWHKGQ